MAKPNLHNLVLDAALLTQVRASIEVLRTNLVPLLQTLSVQERKELPRMGDKSIAFVKKASAYLGVHPDLVPPYVDPDEFKNLLALLEQLQALDRELAPVSDAIRDTAKLTGTEAYRMALLFYRSLKSAQKENIGSSAQVYGDLSNRFPGKRAKKTTEQ